MTPDVKFDIYGLIKYSQFGLTIILKQLQMQNGIKFKQGRTYYTIVVIELLKLLEMDWSV